MSLPDQIVCTVVTDPAQLLLVTQSWAGPWAVDTERFKDDPKIGKLLGISISPIGSPDSAIYVALQWYDFPSSRWNTNPAWEPLLHLLRGLLQGRDLIGHNYSGDKSWIDHVLGIQTKWSACTRLMWHMASAPSGPRPYGLKDGQVELLGWDARGDEELGEQVKLRGGALKTGDHYLADLSVLGKYACLDSASTALLYSRLKPFFDEHDYWWLLAEMVEYSWLLQECTDSGVLMDVDKLDSQIELLKDTRGAYTNLFIEQASPYINRLEREWRDHRASKYVSESARTKFLASWEMHKKFNLSSDKQKQELFYDIMGLPVLVNTEKGKPSTAMKAVKAALMGAGKPEFTELAEVYEEAENANTLLTSFAQPWADEVKMGRLHPRFNPCGTVSYRLSGFKPYLLNAPFDEVELMSCLTCDPGYGGIHADFASIEPAVTAHYSQDPGLLKVFREGKGDVYLDLALTLFPEDKELREGYDPLVVVATAIKKRFKRQRDIAKIIQLAVQYTGTKYTVAKNLTETGFPTTLDKADRLVRAYWHHFHRVAAMNEVLFRQFERDGLLRNVIGRIIRVPRTVAIRKKDGTIWEKPIRYKDLPNRFIQSSAHDLLSLWALKINRAVRAAAIGAKPILVDCHDSTSWQAPLDMVPQLEYIFNRTLAELNDEIGMTVPIRMELKRFSTMAGLKGEE